MRIATLAALLAAVLGLGLLGPVFVGANAAQAGVSLAGFCGED